MRLERQGRGVLQGSGEEALQAEDRMCNGPEAGMSVVWQVLGEAKKPVWLACSEPEGREAFKTT